MVIRAVDHRRRRLGQVLRVARGIAAVPARVAHADVERAIGAELQLPAVVVGVEVVRDREHAARSSDPRRLGHPRSAGTPRPSRHQADCSPCTAHRTGRWSHSQGRTPSTTSPAPRRSRSRRSLGSRTAASRRSRPLRCAPAFSTTNSRLVSVRGAVTNIGVGEGPDPLRAAEAQRKPPREGHTLSRGSARTRHGRDGACCDLHPLEPPSPPGIDQGRRGDGPLPDRAQRRTSSSALAERRSSRAGRRGPCREGRAARSRRRA